MGSKMDKAYWNKRYSERLIWMKEYLGNECSVCGSKKSLEIDHINPEEKGFTLSRAYNKSLENIQKELDKCQLLCNLCHRKKSGKEWSKRFSGSKNYNSKLTDNQVIEIRRIYPLGEYSQRDLAKIYGVSHVCIGYIVRRQSYKNIGVAIR